MGQVKVIDAQIYSVAGEIAYELTYGDGTIVRAVTSPHRIIRKEVGSNGAWRSVGKPYVVGSSKKRAAETIVSMVRRFFN